MKPWLAILGFGLASAGWAQCGASGKLGAIPNVIGGGMVSTCIPIVGNGTISSGTAGNVSVYTAATTLGDSKVAITPPATAATISFTQDNAAAVLPNGTAVAGGNNVTTGGCVTFESSSGVITCDSTNFKWDSTNKQLFSGNNAGKTFGNISISTPFGTAINNDDAGIAIGYNSTTGHSGIAIGVSDNACTSAVGAGMGICIAIGEDVTASPRSIAMGDSITCGGVCFGGSANDSIAIGISSSQTGTNGISVGTLSSVSGNYGISLGYSAVNAFQFSAAIGAFSETTAANQMVFGDPVHGAAITHFYFGGVVDGSSREAAIDMNINAASPGTDIAGKDWTFNSGQGRGSGAGGSIIFNIAVAGSTGTALNTEVERFRVTSVGPQFYTSSTGAGTQTFTNSPCTGLVTERWVPVAITGQTGTWFIPACQ